MRNKHIKSGICCLLIILSFTGCSSTLGLKIPYSETSIQSTNDSIQNSDLKTAEFLSTNLCIVPNGFSQVKDDVITGASSFLFNITDSEIIYAENVYDRIYPASLTKLLTALVVFKYANLEDIVTFSYNASHIQVPGAKVCGFKEGDKVVLEDLLSAFLIYSGNDAGIAIAEHIAGSEEEFVNLMNKEAKSIGAVDTHFVNSHGLHDDNHYTTAYDIYLMFNELLKYDKFTSIINQSSITVNFMDTNGANLQETFYTTNRYLKENMDVPEGLTIIGGKTGTTNKAGNCLILLSKDESGKSYLSLLLNINSGDALYAQMTHLLNKIKN